MDPQLNQLSTRNQPSLSNLIHQVWASPCLKPYLSMIIEQLTFKHGHYPIFNEVSNWALYDFQSITFY